jgi:hypothetical protein
MAERSRRSKDQASHGAWDRACLPFNCSRQIRENRSCVWKVRSDYFGTPSFHRMAKSCRRSATACFAVGTPTRVGKSGNSGGRGRTHQEYLSQLLPMVKPWRGARRTSRLFAYPMSLPAVKPVSLPARTRPGHRLYGRRQDAGHRQLQRQDISPLGRLRW